MCTMITDTLGIAKDNVVIFYLTSMKKNTFFQLQSVDKFVIRFSAYFNYKMNVLKLSKIHMNIELV